MNFKQFLTESFYEVIPSPKGHDNVKIYINPSPDILQEGNLKGIIDKIDNDLFIWNMNKSDHLYVAQQLNLRVKARLDIFNEKGNYFIFVWPNIKINDVKLNPHLINMMQHEKYKVVSR